MTKPPRILAIAGSDSSGGAGIQADIKTITMLGGYAMTAITAITAQNTLGVQEVFALPTARVEAQFFSVEQDIGFDAVKVGMLGTPELVLAVRDLLQLVPPGTPIVVDPVMIATSGDALNATGTAAALHELLSLATVVTPNLPELEALGGVEAILELAPAVLIKGGHGTGETIVDRLVTRDGEVARWEGARIETRHTHGTGCTLSSAVATELGRGASLPQAVERGRQFVRAALLAAPGFGGGNGPLGHAAARL